MEAPTEHGTGDAPHRGAGRSATSGDTIIEMVNNGGGGGSGGGLVENRSEEGTQIDHLPSCFTSLHANLL